MRYDGISALKEDSTKPPRDLVGESAATSDRPPRSSEPPLLVGEPPVLFVDSTPDASAELRRAYSEEVARVARSLPEAMKMLADRSAGYRAVLVNFDLGHAPGVEAEEILHYCKRERPDLKRFLYATYDALPHVIGRRMRRYVQSVLALDGDPRKGAQLIKRALRGSVLPHYEPTENQISVFDAEVLFGPQVLRLLKLTAEFLGGVPGIVIRNLPKDAGDRHVEFVAPMNAAFERVRCELPRYWGWPLKERHQSAKKIKHPVAIAFGELAPRQELYARKLSDEEYVYVAIMPWRKRKRATVLVGVLSRAATGDHRRWIEACHQRAQHNVGEYYLPRVPAQADSLMKVRYVQEYDWVVTDNYSGPDRRAKPTTFVNKHMFTGRRKTVPENIRELAGGFVDRMPKWVLTCVCAYLALSMVDTVLTWVMVSSGKVVEMNPLLRPLIGRHAIRYIVVKNGLTLASIFVVARFHLFQLGRVVLPLNVAMYVVLDVYWVWLLLHIHP
jgi:hypothetical protein